MPSGDRGRPNSEIAAFHGELGESVQFAAITASAGGATQIVAPATLNGTSRKIRVVSYVLIANAAVNVKFQSHVTGDLTGLLYLAANGGAVAPFSPVGWFETVLGEALDINLSGGIPVGGHLTYTLI